MYTKIIRSIWVSLREADAVGRGEVLPAVRGGLLPAQLQRRARRLVPQPQHRRRAAALWKPAITSHQGNIYYFTPEVSSTK